MYDFAIIGAGAAGLNLALAMLRDRWFDDKKILLLEKDTKEVNDKTWCFWEINGGHWDDIIDTSWKFGKFMAKGKSIDLDLNPYRYKQLNSLDFYDHARKLISEAPQIEWLSDEVREIIETDRCEIRGETQSYEANHVFDSRIDSRFFTSDKDKYLRLLQHFKGWFIETGEEVFDPNRFTMMDYRLKWNNSTSFSYVLPSSSRSALIEYTLFTPELIGDEDYDTMLKTYITENLNIKEYQVTKVEQGIIPMTNYPFHHAHTEKITKIGTAGSWVKPSSGYSFKNAERNSMKLIQNIKQGKLITKGLLSGKFRYYDTLLLDILTHKNHLGESIFAFMYQRNSIQKVFRFLDEETNVLEDFSIMATFNPIPFIQAMINQFNR